MHFSGDKLNVVRVSTLECGQAYIKSSYNHTMTFSGTTKLSVGSLVRAKFSDAFKGVSRRAVVATVQEDSACLLYEDEAPRSLPFADQSTSDEVKDRAGSYLQRIFIVAPIVEENSGEAERSVPLEEVEELLPFESLCDALAADDLEVSSWKARGDQLLRRGDVSAATSFYEHALKLTSRLQIGSSIIVRVRGHAKVAEVDCIDAQEGIDVVMQEDGREATIKETDILLCVMEEDSERFQERILLNLSRCLSQIHDISSWSRRSIYQKRAILAATLALTVASFHDEKKNVISNTQLTALILRCQSHLSLSKFQHAGVDLDRLLALEPNHKEGLKLAHELTSLRTRRNNADKKLVKEMCRWVKAATNDSVSEKRSDPVQISGTPCLRREPSPALLAILILIIAIFVQHSLS
jgi:hypothetical protein